MSEENHRIWGAGVGGWGARKGRRLNYRHTNAPPPTTLLMARNCSFGLIIIALNVVFMWLLHLIIQEVQLPQRNSATVWLAKFVFHT